MRTLLLILLAIPLTAFSADEEFDKEVEKLHKALETSFFHAGVKHDLDKDKPYPNDNYVHEYNKIVREHVKKELELYEKYCKKEGDKSCLTEKEVKEKKAQYRITAGLVTRMNEWAKEGASEEKVKERTAAYNACHDKNEGCDKLPVDDREVVLETPADSFPTDEKKDSKAAEVTKESKTKSQTKSASKSSTTVAASASTSTTTTTTTTEDDSEVSVEVSGEDADDKEKPVAKKDDKKPVAKADDKKDGKTAPKKGPKRDVAQKDDKPAEDASASEPELVEASDDEKTPRNYKPETCRWVNDLPRKIVNGPGCGPKNRSKICTGYVICEQKEGGAKFIRMSTCSPDKCGGSDEDAVKCTKDMGYYSMKPQGEEKLFMTPELKKVLSNGSTRQ